MKFTAILLFIACMQVSAKGYSQITLSEKNVPLTKVFKEIQKQSGYDFIYTYEVVQKEGNVSVAVQNATLQQALDACLNGKQLTYTISDKTVVIKSKIENPDARTVISLPPPIEVHGRIVNENGEPVLATVTIKGTKNAVSTNVNGEFILPNVDENAVLVISGVSIETFEVKVNGRTDLAILSAKIKVAEGEEVVVKYSSGYQEIPKERAAGSFTQINNKLYNEQVGTNVLNRLQYISNGLTTIPPRVQTGNNSILIRGLSTTSGVRDPLIIVDNFPYTGDINNINPNDVENITLLKDAAATSIWGTRASNGVIVITTKKGQFNKPIKVALSSNITITNEPDLFYLKNISTADFIDVEQFLFSKNFRFSDTSNSSPPPFSPVYEILFRQRSGLITPDQAKTQIDALRNLDIRNEYEKHFYNKAINQQYAINLNGGSNNIAWILSAGIDRNLNELSSKYNRYNVRFDNTYKVAKNLEINTSAYYTQSDNTSGNPAYGSITTARGALPPPYTQFADANGNPLPLYNKFRQGYIDTLGAGNLLDWKLYPLNDYKYTTNINKIQDINAVIGLNYKLLNFINIDLRYRYEKQQLENQTLYDQQSFFTRDLINLYSQLDRSSGVITYKIPQGEISDLNNNILTAQNIRGQININKEWGKNHFVGLIGSEASEIINNGYKYRTYGYDNEILTSVNVDYANQYPIFTGGSAFIPNNVGFNRTNNRFISFYGNGAYTFNSKYTLTASARRDGSNIFGVKTNDKWKPLWSIGGSWDISSEKFYNSVTIPYLKVRLTYGHSGNVDPSRVAVTTISYWGTNQYTQSPYSIVQNFVNPDLRWEQTNMLNFGIDFKAFGRISGSVEYFKKHMVDLYGSIPLDVTTGLGRSIITKNVGSMKGHGFDIELNTINTVGEVKWATHLIFNYYTDKINSKTLPDIQVSSVTGGGPTNINGYPYFSYFAYKWAGLDPNTGDPQGYMNGQISKDYNSIMYGLDSKVNDLTFVGTLLPKVFGSMGNTINWQGFSLTARITYKLGYWFRRESIFYDQLFNSNTGHSDFSRRWEKPGDETTTNVPSMVYPNSSLRDLFYRNSAALATRGDHIRFQYLNVGYELTKKKLNKLPVDNIKLYLFINNIGIIWRANKEKIDPDYSDLPPARSMALGINISF